MPADNENIESGFRCTGMRFYALLVVTAFSGAAALGHQTVWVRVMVDVLGGNSDTFSKVIGAFFIGLALGAGAASLWAPKYRHRWMWLMLAEICVMALVWPILLIYPASEWLYGALSYAGILQWALPLVLVSPPAFIMGLFLPWLFHAMALEQELTPARAVVLYAGNTLGGVAAIPAVILVLLPSIGLTRTAVTVMAANAFVVICFAALHLMSKPAENHENFEHENLSLPGPSETKLAKCGLFSSSLAFASGFAMLSREVIFQHQVAQISVNSLYSSGSVLAGVLLCLGLASLLVPILVNLEPSVKKVLAAVLFLTAFSVAFQPLMFNFSGGLNGIDYGGVTPFSYGQRLLARALVAFGPAVFFGGFVFPLLIHYVTERGQKQAGSAVGQLLLWNGLGGWLGPEIANLFLGPYLGLWKSLPVLSGIYLFFGLWLIIRGQKGPVFQQKFKTAFAVFFGILVLGGGWYSARGLPHVNAGKGKDDTRVVDYRVGFEGVIAVIENSGHLRLMRNSTYTLGGTRAKAHQERQGLLPLLLHKKPETVALLGTATGSTLAGSALHPDVKKIEGIEISRDTHRLAKRHFNSYNRNVFSDPRVSIILEDARWVVANSQSRYDVVIGDVFLPWKTGTGRIYTREHFKAVKDSLKPGGIYCQWFALFQLSEAQFWSILSTFQDVFPETVLISVDFFSDRPIIGLLGGFSLAGHEWEITRDAAFRLRNKHKTGDPLLRHVEGVQMMILGNAPAPPADTTRNTLRNAHVELCAGRNLLTGEAPWFTGNSYIEFAALVRRNSGRIIPYDHESAQFFLELDPLMQQALQEEDPDIIKTIPEIIMKLPDPFLADTEIDWLTWPSSSRPVLRYIFQTEDD